MSYLALGILLLLLGSILAFTTRTMLQNASFLALAAGGTLCVAHVAVGPARRRA